MTDDWRRHIDARRKALQRRRTKRRGVADGGATFGANGERFYNGTVQTDGNFEEVLFILSFFIISIINKMIDDYPVVAASRRHGYGHPDGIGYR